MAANPVFHIFSLLLTKDVLFSGCFLLWVISLIDFHESLEYEGSAEKYQGRIAVLSLLCCLLRNNMIYVVAVYIAVLFLYKLRITVYRGLCISVVLFWIITKIVYPSLGVAEGNVKEKLNLSKVN